MAADRAGDDVVGHGISVNLVQLARAYTMFATDGEVKAATLFKTEEFVAGRPVLQPETRAPCGTCWNW